MRRAFSTLVVCATMLAAFLAGAPGSPETAAASQASGSVFDALPGWAAGEIPQARNAWAPDVSRFNGKFQERHSGDRGEFDSP